MAKHDGNFSEIVVRTYLRHDRLQDTLKMLNQSGLGDSPAFQQLVKWFVENIQLRHVMEESCE